MSEEKEFIPTCIEETKMSSIAKKCYEWMMEEGLRPSFVNEHAIFFKYQRAKFFFYNDERDPNFVKIDLPYIAETNEENYHVHLLACNEITYTYKVIKAFINDDSVSLCSEMFLNEHSNFDESIGRLIDAMVDTMSQYSNLIDTMKPSETVS